MSERAKNLLIVAVLVAGTLALYGRTARFGFVNLDDGDYAYENPRILDGLSARSIHWAFTKSFSSNWHPLTWMSLMLDVQLWGPSPGAMHRHNAILHAANSALLFWLLMVMTGERWPSAWAAAMFAWHPLHVESVAWISERKDVLSTLFLLLCLLAYVRYVRAPSVRAYLLVALLLILGLMAKQMLVTVPAIMLLLDVWPLRRLSDARTAPPALAKRPVISLLLEKLPLVLIVIAGAVIVYKVQKANYAVTNLAVPLRFNNAIVSYARYLWMMLLPQGLAIFYPLSYSLPGGVIPLWQIVLSGAALILLTTIAVFAERKGQSAVLMGWFWYIGTLLPVIGIIPIGGQSHADRYTYVPLIGIFMAIAWSAAALARQKRALRPVIVALAVGTLIGASALCWRQIGFWRDEYSIMFRAIAVVPKTYVAHRSLGQVYDKHGDRANAEAHYHETLRIAPNDALALRHLATFAASDGKIDEAIDYAFRALQGNPHDGANYNQYANLLVKKGHLKIAIAVYREGLKRDPSMKEARHNLALALAEVGEIDEAIPQWREALKLDPNYAAAHASLGAALLMTGKTLDGIAELRTALRLAPESMDALNTLAWCLATHPNPVFQDGPEAEKLASRAVQLSGGENPIFLDTLAAAQARNGRFDEAVKTAARAADLARNNQMPELAAQIEKRIERYRAGKPFTSGRQAT